MLKRALDAVWPRGSAWAQKVGGGMESLLLGVSDSLDTVHDKLATLANIRNATRTEQLDELEIDFGILPDSALTDAVRRARLDARINVAQSAGTRDRLERELRAAGFDVYVHANSPAVNPVQFGSRYRTVAGGAHSFAGDPRAVAGVFGGVLLVNGASILTVAAWRTVAGGAKAIAGNPEAIAGRAGTTTVTREYDMPTDPATWPFIFFVGGVATRNGLGELTSIAVAEVPNERKAELEETILRLKGTYTWAVLVLNYLPLPPPVLFSAIIEPLNFVALNTINVDGAFEVDWGGGSFISYSAGNASAVASGTITVRSVNAVTQIVAVTDTFTSINIVEGQTLTSFDNSFLGLSNLITFNAPNTLNVTTVNQAWLFCSGLITWSMNTSAVTIFDESLSFCISLPSLPAIDTSAGVSFNNMFNGDTALVCLSALDTTSAATATDLFTGCTSLIAPTAGEQASLATVPPGLNYVNAGSCP